MRSGLMDRLVTIQTPTESADAFGAVVTTWATFAQVYARYLPAGGGEKMQNDEQAASLRGTFRVRWLAGVTPKMRVLDEYGVDWRVKYTAEGGRREWLDLHCEAPSV